MTISSISPRVALVKRSRRHFAAIAAAAILTTGALTACGAQDDPTPAGTTQTGTTSGSGTGGSASASGLTSPDPGSSSSDGGSNAS